MNDNQDMTKESAEHGALYKLPNGVTVETVNLATAGVGVIEYITKLLSSGDKPQTIVVSKDNGDLIRHHVPDKPASDTIANKYQNELSALSGTNIHINEAIPNELIMIYRQPPVQSLSIMGEMDKLFAQAGIDNDKEQS